MTIRKKCIQCGFIQARCLCQYLRKISNQTHVIILQHPSEIKHAIGTVQILRNSLSKISIFQGEDFSNVEELVSLVRNNLKETALVFPDHEKNNDLCTSSSVIKIIILIDGSWKKANKIFFTNPWLNELTKISLQTNQLSQYKIRKTSKTNGLSTLEATVECLRILEPDLETAPLSESFKAMIEFQIEKMGKIVFMKNYKKKGDE